MDMKRLEISTFARVIRIGYGCMEVISRTGCGRRIADTTSPHEPAGCCFHLPNDTASQSFGLRAIRRMWLPDAHASSRAPYSLRLSIFPKTLTCICRVNDRSVDTELTCRRPGALQVSRGARTQRLPMRDSNTTPAAAMRYSAPPTQNTAAELASSMPIQPRIGPSADPTSVAVATVA